MQKSAVRDINVKKVNKESVTEESDLIAVEEPLEIQVEYQSEGRLLKKSVSVTMRTPGHDQELATGFLFTEGILQKRDQISKIRTDIWDENKVLISFADQEIPRLQTAERNFYTTSSCGVCGKSSIDAIKTVSSFIDQSDDLSVAADLFYNLQNELKKQQEVFQNTGGLHASGLFDLEGNLILLKEDVGRHNALDKVIGASFLQDKLPLNQNILLLSGRASFELIQKASMAGIKIVAAIGAPSSLALQLAEEFGMTLIGFLGKDRFNIYSGSSRIRI